MGHRVEVVVEHLQCLGEGVDFIGDFVAYVTHSGNVLEYLLLLVLEVLVEPLRISQGLVDVLLELDHSRLEILMLRLNLPPRPIKQDLRGFIVIAAATTHVLHQSEVLDLRAELLVQALDGRLNLLDLLLVFFSVRGDCLLVILGVFRRT